MDKSTKNSNVDQTRRDFVKKAAYATPAIVTMAAIPSFASAGSGFQESRPVSQSFTTTRSHRQDRQHRNIRGQQ